MAYSTIGSSLRAQGLFLKASKLALLAAFKMYDPSLLLQDPLHCHPPGHIVSQTQLFPTVIYHVHKYCKGDTDFFGRLFNLLQFFALEIGVCNSSSAVVIDKISKNSKYMFITVPPLVLTGWLVRAPNRLTTLPIPTHIIFPSVYSLISLATGLVQVMLHLSGPIKFGIAAIMKVYNSLFRSLQLNNRKKTANPKVYLMWHVKVRKQSITRTYRVHIHDHLMSLKIICLHTFPFPISISLNSSDGHI